MNCVSVRNMETLPHPHAEQTTDLDQLSIAKDEALQILSTSSTYEPWMSAQLAEMRNLYSNHVLTMCYES